MATCNGCGITVTEDNRVALDNDRSQAWGYPGTVANSNGLRCDPVSNKVWVPPDQVISRAEATALDKTVIPNDAGTVLLTDINLEMTASPKHNKVLFLATLTLGHAGFRMGSGNFWSVDRWIATYINAIPVAFTNIEGGLPAFESIASCENNAGASLGHGGPIDSLVGTWIVDGGSVFKVRAKYQLSFLAFTDGPTNGLAWRAPRLSLVQWSMPEVAVAGA